MTILSRFLKLLEWLENAQAFFYFLSQPIGLSTAVALCLYCPIQLLGCDSLSAMMLAFTAGFILFGLLERPEV